MQVGRLAGELVSGAFPAVMDLKFERVCQPFMMLHVNRSALPLLTLICMCTISAHIYSCMTTHIHHVVHGIYILFIVTRWRLESKERHACSPAADLRQSVIPWWGCGRYAGQGYEREEDVGRGGTLLVKGLKSMWRQAAPIVRNTLQGALRRIIMQVRLCVNTSCPKTM